MFLTAHECITVACCESVAFGVFGQPWPPALEQRHSGASCQFSVSDAHTHTRARSLIQTDGDARVPLWKALQVRLSNALNWRHAGYIHSIVSISAFSVYENIILFKSSQSRNAVRSHVILFVVILSVKIRGGLKCRIG